MWYCILPADHAGKHGRSWWADAIYIVVGCLIGGTAVAGYGVAARYVSGRIAALRAKHQAPESPNHGDAGGGDYMVRHFIV
jgi:hypothetical protein